MHPVVRPADEEEFSRIEKALSEYSTSTQFLPGVADDQSRLCLAAQFVDSARRRRYVTDYLCNADLSNSCLDPADSRFDPIRGAILCRRRGDLDEACWLVFLSVHFGYHRQRRWDLPAAFFRRDGSSRVWNWDEVRSDVLGVRRWLDANQVRLRNAGLRFGNHRKYESLSGSKSVGTGAVIESFVAWVASADSTLGRPEFTDTLSSSQQFRAAYESMDAVHRFGRTARFDYLTMLGKTEVMPGLVPDATYLAGATGPLSAARLLFDGTSSSATSRKTLESRLADFQIGLVITNDVLEDGLCNWQKSPSAYLSFRG